MKYLPFIISFLAVIGVVVYIFRPRKDVEVKEDVIYRLDKMKDFARNVIKEAISVDNDVSRSEMRQALRLCMLGSRKDKLLVKSYLRDQLSLVYDFTEENCDKVIPFSKPSRLTSQEKFDIILYNRIKKHGADAFAKLVGPEPEGYNLFKLREVDFEIPETENGVYLDALGNPVEVYGTNTDKKYMYYISVKDVENIYALEDIKLDANDMREIIIQRIYQEILGLGPIDELRDQKIDGVSGGTTGVPQDIAYTLDISDYSTGNTYVPPSYSSIAVFFKGVTMQIQALSFGSQEELVRVAKLIYTYNNPGQINRKKGHVVNEMADHSRVVVVAPELTDRWAFFVRKFDEKLVDLRALWKHPGAALLVSWIFFQMRGAVTAAFTGDQGTGKTLTMKAAVGSIYPWYNLRIQEGSFFEMNLSQSFPNVDVLPFKETDSMTAIDGMVLQRKTNGTVNILAEIADDRWFPIMLKMGQAGSKFTFFSHHATTAEGLMDTIRNSVVASGLHQDPKEAEKFILSILRVDVHFENDRGNRYVSRVTEFVPVKEKIEFDETFIDTINENPVKSMAQFNKVLYQKILRDEAPVYRTSDIIVYENGEFVPKNRPSQELIEYMKKNMIEEDSIIFEEFIEKYWGKAS